MQTYVLMLQTDEDDKELTESILAEMKYPVQIKYAGGVQEMDEWIIRSGLPALILLNVRGANYKGTEVIAHVKSRPGYAHIPVVVLGEIAAPDYIRQWYRAGASSFITKPSTMEGTQKKIRTFFEYWFEVVQV